MSIYIKHVFHAFRYSIAGWRRLWQEKAARLEVLFAFSQLLLYIVLEAALWQHLLLIVSFFVILALESLNTALEVLTDHLTQSHQEFAAHAKDLGSFAVFCGLVCQSILTFYVGWLYNG